MVFKETSELTAEVMMLQAALGKLDETHFDMCKKNNGSIMYIFYTGYNRI